MEIASRKGTTVSLVCGPWAWLRAVPDVTHGEPFVPLTIVNVGGRLSVTRSLHAAAALRRAVSLWIAAKPPGPAAAVDSGGGP